MIYSEKWCCCSGMRVFKTMPLHNCIFILPILICDFCFLTLLWFESTTWISNHKRNWMDMKISHECILHNKKRKNTFEKLEKLTRVFIFIILFERSPMIQSFSEWVLCLLASVRLWSFLFWIKLIMQWNSKIWV